MEATRTALYWSAVSGVPGTLDRVFRSTDLGANEGRAGKPGTATQSGAGEPRRRAALLLRELSDESLALAIQKEFWWVDAFEELFVHRYEEKLIRWFYSWRVMNHEDAGSGSGRVSPIPGESPGIL